MTIENELNIFYGAKWVDRDQSLDQYEYSGYLLGERVRYMERVLHVNCGINPFKEMIPNLVGIDATSHNADVKESVHQYAVSHIAHKFDVAFYLGSLVVDEQEIATMINLLKKRDGRIYWRCHTPGSNPAGTWTADELVRLSERFNFEIIEMFADANDTIYAEWLSNNRTHNSY